MTPLKLKPYTSLDFRDFPLETIIKIEKSDFQNVQYQDGKIVFTLFGCKFKKVVIENAEEIDFKDISIQFVDCFIEEISVETIVTKNISLHFGSSIVSGRVNSDSLTNVSLNNVIISNGLFLLNQNSVYVSFTEENIFPIRWRKLLKSLQITDLSQFLKTKQSYYIYDTKKITFRTNEASNGKVGLITENNTVIRRDYTTRYQLSPIQKNYLNINLSLSFSKDIEKSDVKISNSLLNSLSIKGEQNGKLKIENTKIDSWYIHEFTIEGEAIFYNINPHSKLSSTSKIEIHESSLDNAWFDNISFDDYTTVSFYRTRLGKARFSSCSFPTNYTSFEKFKSLENVHYPDKKSDNYYKDQYEIFLQLKNALEANGNFYESQKLQAISNDALKKIKDVDRWDKVILWINSKSNNHGLSIRQPLKYFLLFSIGLYILYLLSLNRIFNCNEIDWSLVGYYFSFIDLTHRTDFLVDKSEFNAASLIIDFVNKIVAGFFIYQFISAFRKYGKK